MKYNLYKKYLILIGIVAVLCSCKKTFLEVEPKGKLLARTMNDYNLMMNNDFYDIVPFNVDGQVLMGDEVASIEPYFSNMFSVRGYKYFTYADQVYQPDEDGTELKVLMTQLYTYNKIINELPNATGGTEVQRSALMGEALTNRAWIYFMLINYYGKPYLQSTAATDAGFPIVTTADVTVNKFERASVQAVYDFIITDLKNAIPGLPISAGNRIRVSKAAAEALLGKVYLFMGKFEEGLVEINNAFTHLPTAYPVILYDYKVTLAAGGPWDYDPDMTPEMGTLDGIYETVDNEEILFAKQTPNHHGYFFGDVLLTPKARSLYQSDDMRLRLFLPTYVGGEPIPIPNMLRRIGPLYTHIGISMPELYLMKAELKARTGDVGGAKTDLETFRKKRMTTGFAVNISDRTEMIKFVIDERTREFAVQGHRWFDMRRLSVDPIFAGKTYVHQAFTETGVLKATFTLKPERFVWQLPLKMINANPGMKNNP